ncbi:cytochrome c oxidase subunit VIIc [Tirmania nivea]|nr:cytochrome c oxidase subunit VIIc [Tirmania nivea]
MLSRAAVRALAGARPGATVGRRGLHATPARLGGYHYPEGPRSNLPFNPLTRFFYLRYIAFCATGFGLPFAIAVWQLNKSKS